MNYSGRRDDYLRLSPSTIFGLGHSRQPNGLSVRHSLARSRGRQPSTSHAAFPLSESLALALRPLVFLEAHRLRLSLPSAIYHYMYQCHLPLSVFLSYFFLSPVKLVPDPANINAIRVSLHITSPTV